MTTLAPDAMLEAAAIGLSKAQLIDQIMSLNPTATTSFLEAFQESGLRNYLDHLLALQTPRGREATWTRRADTPAIVAAEPLD
jgi:hypothetical protein